MWIDEFGAVHLHLDGAVHVKEYEFTEAKEYDEGYCIYNDKGEHFVFCYEVARGGNPFFSQYEVNGELEDFQSDDGCDITVSTFGYSDRLYEEIGIDSKAYQAGIRLTLQSKTKTTSLYLTNYNDGYYFHNVMCGDDNEFEYFSI